MPEEINLLDLFNTASQAIQTNQSKLNQADSFNGNHGDNMVEILDVITQALRDKKSSDPAAQLEYAAQLLRQKTSSGSSNVIANGLAQAAKQVTGKTVQLEGVLDILQTILNGGKNEPNTGTAGNLLETLLSRVGSAKEEKQKDTDWLRVGLDLLKAAKEAGIDLGALAQSLVSGTEMGKSEHRSQSGQIIINAILKLLAGSDKKPAIP